MTQEEKLRKEYYDWQWKTYPSDEAGSFYPLRTNKEIADWWITKLEEERNAVLNRAWEYVVKASREEHGSKEDFIKFVNEYE